MLIQGVNVEAVGHPRGWHEQMPDGSQGPEFIGIWVEIRYQSTLKIRVMCKWVTQGNLNSIVCAPPQGFGMSDELSHKVCQVAQTAIVRELGALELKAVIDRNVKREEGKLRALK